MHLTNEKIEFLKAVNGKEILCAEIIIQQGIHPTYLYSSKEIKEIKVDELHLEGRHRLKRGFQKDNLEKFLIKLEKLEKEYDMKVPYIQRGIIWFTDGSWAEHDHTIEQGCCNEDYYSEEWKYRCIPPIPTDL